MVPEVWIHAVDPPRPLDTRAEYRVNIPGERPHLVLETTADLARWATGRSVRGTHTDDGAELPRLGRWL
ncbi:hypothetical protein SAMN04487819_10662 [Actinopolyspora alba]|uniref:Uncharacterized protein n=1 Tax=Actinopolyspora alba TaxID=673379 RepID=A0A1I1WRV9_9ACTN|nr:hypothetical protein [Actinopolyspora alba]SFD97907.1 hypothetical protein SAMN04487819_10662 [Actinopolyspora alba]